MDLTKVLFKGTHTEAQRTWHMKPNTHLKQTKDGVSPCAVNTHTETKHTNNQAYKQTFIHTHTNIQACKQTYTHMHMHMHARMHAGTCMHGLASRHARGAAWQTAIHVTSFHTNPRSRQHSLRVELGLQTIVRRPIELLVQVLAGVQHVGIERLHAIILLQPRAALRIAFAQCLCGFWSSKMLQNFMVSKQQPHTPSPIFALQCFFRGSKEPEACSPNPQRLQRVPRPRHALDAPIVEQRIPALHVLSWPQLQIRTG